MQNNYIKNVIMVKSIHVASKTATDIGDLVSSYELVVFSSG